MGNGFIPTGTGPRGERFGRDAATGLAFKADGTVRAKRRTFSAVEQMERLAEQARRAMGGIGRSILRTLTGFAAFRGTVGTFRKWVRDCRAYATPEACAERRRYHEAMLAAIDGKHKAAVAWLPKADKATGAIDALYAKVGEAFAAFRKANGRDPDAVEAEAIVGRFLTPEVRAIVEGAADPSNDPFAAFRRDAAEPEASDEDEDGEDTLTDEDDED